MSASAFLTMAPALLPHSSYAWGAAIMVVVTLATAPHWLRQSNLPPGSWALALSIALMGLVWLYGSDFSTGASVFNKPSRYFFALPCLFCLLRYPPRRQWLLNGIVCGAAMGGLYALYVSLADAQARPWVTGRRSSNAIQLGNLCGLFGLVCWIQLTLYWQRWHGVRKVWVLACLALGLTGLLLSQSRGGWLAIVLCLPVLLGLVASRVSLRHAVVSLALLLAVLLPAGWWQSDHIAHRVELAVQQVKAYDQSNTSNTSVGQRLEHWRIAWDMGLSKPLTGWGVLGYEAEKKRRVDAGQADSEILRYGHAHNEILDQFAKRGAIGVTGLLLLYGIPLFLFWPWRRTAPAGRGCMDELCLRLVGVSVPIAFAGYGLTQVFFAHYNGVILYLMLIMFIFAALHGDEES